MTTESKILTVERQALIEALLKQEKEGLMLAFLLMQCTDQLEYIHRRLRMISAACESSPAREALVKLFMTQTEWDGVMTDDLRDQWQAQFRTPI